MRAEATGINAAMACPEHFPRKSSDAGSNVGQMSKHCGMRRCSAPRVYVVLTPLGSEGCSDP